MDFYYIYILIAAPILFYVIFCDDENDHEKNPTYNATDNDKVLSHFKTNTKDSLIKKIIKSISEACFYVFLVVAVIGSLLYSGASILDWLFSVGSLTHATLGLILIIFWSSLWLFIKKYEDSDQDEDQTEQEASIKNRTDLQENILKKLLHKTVTFEEAMDELNELYSIEAIKIVEEIKKDGWIIKN